MSVWKSDEKLIIFASLIYPSKIILFEKQYQAFDTVFHYQMNHLEVRQKYSTAVRIFNSLLGVPSGDGTLRLLLDILLQTFSLFLASSVTVLNLASWPSAKDLELDDSQSQALQLALTKEFAVVQGPPGTGKTYIGLKVLTSEIHLY